MDFGVPLHARDAIVHLLDRYGDELRISRRQLADEARVNPGQLSNWLKNDGPLAVEKEGRTANVIIERVEEYLRRKPGSEIEGPLKRLREPLQSFGPRRRMFAADPAAATKGAPISRENPHYIVRLVEKDLEDKLRNDVIAIEITGGPKMGKSSMLLAAQQVIEASRSAILIDFADYKEPRSPATQEEAESDLFQWIARRCEEQLSGSFPVPFDSVGRMPRWVAGNLLANALNARCVLLFDNFSELWRDAWPTPPNSGRDAVPAPFWLFDSLDRALLLTFNRRTEIPELRRFGVVFATDRARKGMYAWDEKVGGSSSLVRGRLDLIDLRLLGENDVASLLRTHDPAGTDDRHRSEIFRAGGGHPYVTQLMCQAAFATGWQTGLRQAAAELATAFQEQWHSKFIKTIRNNVGPNHSTLDTKEATRLLGSGLFMLIASDGGEFSISVSSDILMESVLSRL